MLCRVGRRGAFVSTTLSRSSREPCVGGCGGQEGLKYLIPSHARNPSQDAGWMALLAEAEPRDSMAESTTGRRRVRVAALGGCGARGALLQLESTAKSTTSADTRTEASKRVVRNRQCVSRCGSAYTGGTRCREEEGAWVRFEPVDACPRTWSRPCDGPQREEYEALSISAKRAVLYSLYSAKREHTRANLLASPLEGGQSLPQ